MEKFKFILFSIVVLMVLGLLGYWALYTIEPGGVHADIEKQNKLEAENEQLVRQVKELKNQLASLQALAQEQTVKEPTQEPVKKPAATATTSSKNQSLINELQKLIDAKVLMKEKSQGSRVGTVQKFLNIYNNTSKTIDNDYGPGMKTDIIKFQAAEGLSADGEAGPGTFAKMIEWLEKQ